MTSLKLTPGFLEGEFAPRDPDRAAAWDISGLSPKNYAAASSPSPPPGLQILRPEYTNTIEPARALSTEALGRERALAHLVNQAYALTPEETALL